MGTKRMGTKLAAGSLMAAAVLAALTPLNMGGCGDVGTTLSTATGVIAGGGRGGSGFSGSTADKVGAGIGVVQGGAQVIRSATLGEADERALGECVALKAAGQYGVVRDDRLTQYVTMVAQTIADATPAGGKPVAFVLDTDAVNAYSGPTGYIMITRGLLNRLGDESELAGVLAHEMGHVVERHGLEAVKTSEFYQGLLKAGAAAAGRNADLVNLGGQVADQALGTPFNQGQERQADADAVAYLVAAGYDPEGYVRALQRLEGGGNSVLSTHPGIGERVQNVRSEIARRGARGGQTNAARFRQYVPGR